MLLAAALTTGQAVAQRSCNNTNRPADPIWGIAPAPVDSIVRSARQRLCREIGVQRRRGRKRSNRPGNKQCNSSDAVQCKLLRVPAHHVRLGIHWLPPEVEEIVVNPMAQMETRNPWRDCCVSFCVPGWNSPYQRQNPVVDRRHCSGHHRVENIRDGRPRKGRRIPLYNLYSTRHLSEYF